MVTISELLEADEDELIDELCIVVDCRGSDESIIRDIGEQIDHDLAPTWYDLELWFTWNGWQHMVLRTLSMADRYVTIDSAASVIAFESEIRVHKIVLEDDTHSLPVLPDRVWKQLDVNQSSWEKRIR